MTRHEIRAKVAPRPEVFRFEPYKAGLSIEQIERQYGLKKVIKLASNENPYGPSPKGLAAYKEAASSIFRYPENNSVDLRKVIADRYKMDIAQVIVGAGSDEIIEMLAKAYLTPQDEIVVSACSFTQYTSVGHLMGARVVEVPMKAMKHDLLAMAAAVTDKTKFIFIANPNNPTGTYNTRDEVEAFFSQCPDHVIPVFDEAYFEYARLKDDYPFALDDFGYKRPLVTLRTFSKVYGLAGLRVGYAMGPDNLIETLDRIKPPFNVSLPAQAAAQAAMYDVAHVKKSVESNAAEMKILEKRLIDMGFTVIPSATNFLLFQVQPLTGRTLFDRLLRKGIIVRCVDEYGLPDYLRVTVGKPNENKQFLKALREVVKEK